MVISNEQQLPDDRTHNAKRVPPLDDQVVTLSFYTLFLYSITLAALNRF
ncbi:hypothetical protein [Paenibacillus baekrokdamisoli]|nr:hypothetical protein [Paenibacillus baekrokdamisoli]